MTQTDDKDGGFLTGWSRRKRAAMRQQETPPQTAPDQPVPDLDDAQQVAPQEQVVDADLIAALPSLDEITAGFDIKPFLAKGVPASLKNAALRRLWLASPLVRDYADPAVDYAWDWNAPGGVPGGGGVLSDKSVAKMVKDLIGTRSDPATDTGEKDEIIADAADIEKDTIPAQPTPEVSASVRQTTLDEKTALAEHEPAAPEKEIQTRTQIAPQRRHGGAAPE